MSSAIALGQATALPVQLQEWDEATPSNTPSLKGLTFRDDARSMAAIADLWDRVNIRESYDGITIGSTSWVGRVEVGPLLIEIRPKLDALPLTRLFRYAYGLRDLELRDEAETPLVSMGFQDLLVEMLCSEVEELLHRGLIRRYIKIEGNVHGLRGRVLMDRLARSGGTTSANLPCRYHERRSNWSLNQVLRAGLQFAAGLAIDHNLRRRAHRLADMFGEVEPKRSLGIEDVRRELRALSRLTEATRAALGLTSLLVGSVGTSLEGTTKRLRTPGFLFDMNRFFEALLSRFLGDHLSAGTLVDQMSFRNLFSYIEGHNPRNRQPPAPRPDFALIKGRSVRAFLDAKYRDIWIRGCPPEWLYQLSIYALASPSRESVLLYGTTVGNAMEERIAVRPSGSWESREGGLVTIRPVPLLRMAELVEATGEGRDTVECSKLAKSLVLLSRSFT